MIQFPDQFKHGIKNKRHNKTMAMQNEKFHRRHDKPTDLQMSIKFANT